MKWAINGFGRIGRGIMRAALEKGRIKEIVAIHDFAPIESSVHLLKYDSVFRNFKGEIKVKDNSIYINGHEIKYLHRITDNKFPWGDLKVDVVMECTGKFISRGYLLHECSRWGNNQWQVTAGPIFITVYQH